MPRKSETTAAKLASKELKFEIKKTIDTISDSKNGNWHLELNVISWNDAKPKYDLRSWNEDHTRMTKGITLNAEEVAVLKEVLAEIDPYAIEEM